jgi:hypothetical protein
MPFPSSHRHFSPVYSSRFSIFVKPAKPINVPREKEKGQNSDTVQLNILLRAGVLTFVVKVEDVVERRSGILVHLTAELFQVLLREPAPQ